MTMAVLGTGIMGAAMARNWLKAGETVRVWNRTPSKAEPLADDGAHVIADAAEAVDGADVVVTMLYDGAAVEQTMRDAASGLRPGVTWLQMSTVGVPAVDDLAELAARHDLQYVDAPVLGTRAPAEAGQLTVLASGPAALETTVIKLVSPVSGKTVWLGPAGQGSRAKMVMNSWVLSIMLGLGQTIALAEGVGVDPQMFLDLIQGGAMDVGYAHVKGKAMMSRDYATSFPVSGAMKDARLIGELARSVGVDSSTVDVARALFEVAAERGHKDADMAAIVEAVRPRRSA
jgi:3-hydroxyisobutyrate dehydrogenase